MSQDPNAPGTDLPRKQYQDDWDAAFESDDPTRVLSPLETDAQRVDGSPATASTRPAGSFASATRERVFSTPAPAVDAEPGWARAGTAENTAFGEENYAPETIQDRYQHLQLIPCALGWLTSYGVLSILMVVTAAILGSFNAPTYATAGQGLATIPHEFSRSWPFLLSLGLTYLLAYGAGGYAATRMARYAPIKQAFGVWLWGIFATVIATIVVFLSDTSTPKIALQTLVGDHVASGILGVLALFILALIGAIIGAGLGTRYQRLHLKEQTPKH